MLRARSIPFVLVLLATFAPAGIGQDAPQGLKPGLTWKENYAGVQILAVPESERHEDKEDRLFLVPHANWSAVLWEAQSSAAADGSVLVKATVRDLIVTTIEPGRTEPESKPTDHKDAWFAYRAGKDGAFVLDGWKSSKPPDETARESVGRDFLLLMPLEPGLKDLHTREPGKEWVLTGPAAVRLYRFDLPQLEFVKSAEVRLWVQAAGADPAGGVTVVLKAVVRTEIDRQGRKILRTGEGQLVYDLERRMLRSYRFAGDVHLSVPIEKKITELDGTWSASGMRRFP